MSDELPQPPQEPPVSEQAPSEPPAAADHQEDSLAQPERPAQPEPAHKESRPSGVLPTSRELRLTIVGCVVGLTAFVGGAAGAIAGHAISEHEDHHLWSPKDTILVAPKVPNVWHHSDGFRDRYFGPDDAPPAP